MGYATQVTAIRPGAWQMERDTVPQQQDRHRPAAGASRFAAALDQAVAGQDGPGRRWTENPIGGGPLHPALIGANVFAGQATPTPHGQPGRRDPYRV
ncbi:hypothetical protein ACFOGJ_19170 [Marinibaculum pumilum]|uniref:Uncharacterized protein n=1 Tax=Marinibaculum pumilum TaxID=1766165 RepID=A0ABV7L3X9_9PROT